MWIVFFNTDIIIAVDFLYMYSNVLGFFHWQTDSYLENRVDADCTSMKAEDDNFAWNLTHVFFFPAPPDLLSETPESNLYLKEERVQRLHRVKQIVLNDLLFSRKENIRW